MLSSILGEERKPIRVDAQCVRSASFWSCGTRTIEHSIQNAYIHMIDSAQHFIYIEVIEKMIFFFFKMKIGIILESIFCFNC
jgi:phosphatidylserine/phosphatidylglycerophosphate/cardiolipin synthase-like enzyme